MADTATLTFGYCVTSAKRLLEFAEGEIDLAKMERLEKLADSWITLASLLRAGNED